MIVETKHFVLSPDWQNINAYKEIRFLFLPQRLLLSEEKDAFANELEVYYGHGLKIADVQELPEQKLTLIIFEKSETAE